MLKIGMYIISTYLTIKVYMVPKLDICILVLQNDLEPWKPL